MYYHPAMPVLIAAIALLFTIRCNKIFAIIAIISPVISVILLLAPTACEIQVFTLLATDFIVNFSPQNKLIALSFIIVLLTANIYALAQGKVLEIIIGNFYGASALACLFAGDFISIFITLEFMMLTATTLIFLNKTNNSIRAARQYLLTHLFSGSLILSGSAYIIVNQGSSELVLLTPLIDFYTPTAYHLILTGCLINVAMLPFSSWMIKCYGAASASSFLYLTAFTTQVSIITLIKLFSGLEVLKFCGSLMVVYACYRACIENNLKRLFCYFTLGQLGFMLIGISLNNNYARLAVTAYIFIHIIYKTLWGVLIGILEDKFYITSCDDSKTKAILQKPLFLLSTLLLFAMIASIPPLSPFVIKTSLSSLLNDYSYYAILLLNFVSIIAFPWLKFIFPRGDKSTFFYFSHFWKNFNLVIIALITLLVGIFWQNILAKFGIFIPKEMLEFNLVDTIKQLVLLLAGIIFILLGAAFPINIARINGKEATQKKWARSLHLLAMKMLNKTLSFGASVIQNILLIRCNIASVRFKLSLYHNQNLSIFVVFSLLITLIFTLKNA